MDETTVLEVLCTVIHPETGLNLVEGQYIDSAETFYDDEVPDEANDEANDDMPDNTPDDDTPPRKITVRLRFRKRRDPFASSLARKAREALSARFPESEICVETVENNNAAAGTGAGANANANNNAGAGTNTGANANANNANAGAGANANTNANANNANANTNANANANNANTEASVNAGAEITKNVKKIAGGARIIAVASGKGGVGKSTVTSNIAVALRKAGFRVGILDADIYGPSQPKIFGCEEFSPELEVAEGTEYMTPAVACGIKIMSIGFFVGRRDALLWRGPMATSALRQLLHQTLWGELDYLLCDLPPGTGDIHLSLISELNIDGAVIVSTPQVLSVADAVRGVEMLRNERVNVPVIGIVENMSWFTPAELPESRYYIFGRGGARQLAESCGTDFLGEIPLTAAMGEASEEGLPAAEKYPFVEEYYRQTVLKIVEKCPVSSR